MSGPPQPILPPLPPMHHNSVERFKALGDPIRWQMICRIAASGELPWSGLDDLSISKPTVSYHIRTLVQVGLVSVRKEGRNAYYSLRREALNDVIELIHALSRTAAA